MIAAIMQPYFFPYIGYFQLMRSVDVFVFYDDAQYMKGGWINRNRIKTQDGTSWVTLPVRRASISFAINQRNYLLDGDQIGRIERQIAAAYDQADSFPDLSPLVADLLRFDDANVARYNAHLLTVLARRFGIGAQFLTSSEINTPDTLRGQAKIIDLCQRIGADHYINVIGGCALYNPDAFSAAGIRLSFLQTKVPPEYLANGPQYLSIIDGLMRQGVEQSLNRLSQYRLLDGGTARTSTFKSEP